ncbi:MAG: hypothetical protein QOK05_2004 [Chloroflexota bacterium]|nr:hypothetical protein [Chloroflexota bacterium]
MRRSLAPFGFLALGLTVASTGPVVALATPAMAPSNVEIKVLSNRADLVSGGDALVEVLLPAGQAGGGLAADVDGRDVSRAFAERPALAGRMVGLLGGLRDGANTFTARLPGGQGARLTITSHPIGGPVFAGPQVQPWVCATTAAGLGDAVDAQCDTPPVYTYSYKSSTTGNFAAYDPSSPPSDIASTTTDQGVTVPYIVRKERGVIDRGIYDIAVLFDPANSWTPWSPQRGWNHKLEVLAGVACDAGHKQLAPSQNVLDDTALSRGFAVFMNEMDDNTQDCNGVVEAEAMMMTKEHFIEAYGELRYTIGQGCSGGSMTQHMIAANYPGLYDGIMPACSFPDMMTTYQEMADCKLLAQYFDVTSPGLWTEQQRAWASGHASAGTCEFQAKARSDSYVSATGNSISLAGPTSSGPSCHGNTWTYDPATNPGGTRCGIQDYQVAVFGTRPPASWGPIEQQIGRGFANRPYDNVGVEYGLGALQAGQIAPEQFVDLNEKVGGLDIDGNIGAGRSAGDALGVANAYRSGQLINARQLSGVAIIDMRGSSNFEEHFDWHTYEFRNRLRRDTGSSANMIYWEGPCCLETYTLFQARAFDLMDRWLGAVEKDTSDAPVRAKLVRDKPTDAVDACWLGGQEVTDQQVCGAALPYYREARFVAGGPDTADVVQCRLKPLRRLDYTGTVPMTDAQFARLQAVFPGGVCDYSRPGISQQSPAGPWMSYAQGPGGQVLGARPVSVPLVQTAVAAATLPNTGAVGPPGLLTLALALPLALLAWRRAGFAARVDR